MPPPHSGSTSSQINWDHDQNYGGIRLLRIVKTHLQFASDENMRACRFWRLRLGAGLRCALEFQDILIIMTQCHNDRAENQKRDP